MTVFIVSQANLMKSEPMIETKRYADGTTATGTAPLPVESPAEQEAWEREVMARFRAAPTMEEAAEIVSKANLERRAVADAVPLCDNLSGDWCRDCRETGLSHCGDPEHCGGMQPMRHHEKCRHWERSQITR